MKRLSLGLLIGGVVLVLALAGVALAGMMIPAADQAKQKAQIAVNKSPALEGDWALSPPGLERIEFIHYKKGYGKPETAKGPKAPTCYKFLTPGKNSIRWRTLPVSYVINPTNSGLEASFVTTTISTSAETWDNATSQELFDNTYGVSTGPETNYGVQNYTNALSFGDRYSDPNVIAATVVWYNPATKAIVEFDITFETDYTWGNADLDPTVMDLQNIATHELGHGVGLADVYDSTCSEVTMYGYSTWGETKKRTLEAPDITGLQKLYGL